MQTADSDARVAVGVSSCLRAGRAFLISLLSSCLVIPSSPPGRASEGRSPPEHKPPLSQSKPSTDSVESTMRNSLETFLRLLQTGAIVKEVRRTAEGNLMARRVITYYDECGGDKSYLKSYLVNLAINRGEFLQYCEKYLKQLNPYGRRYVCAQLFSELCASLITFRIVVRSQRLIARNVRELFSFNRAVTYFHAARRINELSRGCVCVFSASSP